MPTCGNANMTATPKATPQRRHPRPGVVCLSNPALNRTFHANTNKANICKQNKLCMYMFDIYLIYSLIDLSIICIYTYICVYIRIYVSYCIVLYCIVLHCIVLHCIVLYGMKWYEMEWSGMEWSGMYMNV